MDVEHDFAPHTRSSADRSKQLAEIERAAKERRRRLPRHRPRPRGRGHRLARRRGRPPVPGQDAPGDLQRDHASRRSARRSPTRASIDQHLVDAQQARRIVDRLVGYTLSPLLWRKVRSRPSAGRVQSVAVRLVVEREREIRAFKAREYWTIEALLADARPASTFARRAGPDRRREARRSATSATAAAATPRRSAQTHAGRRVSRDKRRSAARRRRSPPPRCSRRRAASSASARSGRCRSRSGCTRASRRPTATSA